MAIRTTAATGRFSRTANLLDHELAYTYMLWVRFDTSIVQQWILNINDDTVPTYDLIGANNSSQLWLRCYKGGDLDAVGSTLTSATWYHMALVRESVTSLKAYLNGVVDATSTGDVTGRTSPNRLDYSGYASGGSSPFNGRGTAFKAWGAALTADEIVNEMYSFMPRRWANLHQWSPMLAHSDVTDISGNGFNWTADGSPTTEDGPPAVSWGGSVPRAGVRSTAVAPTRRLLALTGVG